MRKLVTGVVAAAVLAGAGITIQGSSHREAPGITKTPKVDGTDFYMFRSFEAGRDGYVTLLANYIPLQDVYGGPNFFMLDEDAVYEIHVDNNADARRGRHLPVPVQEHAEGPHRARRRQETSRFR